MLFGYLSGGWLMARSAVQAHAQLEAGTGDAEFLKAKGVSARFYAEQLLPVYALLAAVSAGSASIMALDDEQF
jgi:hypothetical protein